MTTQRRSLHIALVAGLMAAATVGAGSPAESQRAVPRVAPSTVPVSMVALDPSNSPSTSGNGQFVVFVSAPTADDGRTSSVWLSNRKDGAITELTLPKDGIRLGNSVSPVISADGCSVVVTTEMAFDLFRDDDQGMRWDVYRATLPACGGSVGDWALVSTRLNTEGLAQARGDVDPLVPPALSSSGTVVAYVRPYESRSGVEDPAYLPASIDVVDLTVPVDDRDHVTPVPGLPAEVAGTPIKYVGQSNPSLSADGTMLAFVSDATAKEAVADWVLPESDGVKVPTQVFIWNRNDADPFTAVSLISVGDAAEGNGSSSDPVLSADARTVAFSSTATNLVSDASLVQCAATCPSQVYVVQRDIDGNLVYDEPGGRSISLVSATRPGEGQPSVAGNGASFDPTITADGTTVVFASHASNLLTVQAPGGGGVNDGDLLVADLARNELRRVFDSPEPVPGAHSHPRLSANGRMLVADSLVADRLVGNPAVAGRNVVTASFAPSLSMADLDLGTVLVKVPGPEWRVYVVNQGPGTFLPAIVTTDNPQAFNITGGTCFDQAPVAAGGYCDVTLLLIPQVPGPVRATLTVAEVGFGAITLVAPLRGAGGEPTLDALPSGKDLGSSVVGERGATPAVFNITNIGFLPTVVSGVKIAGANPDDFAVTANGCRGELLTLLECEVEVSFTPTAAGRRTASINFSTPQGQYTSVLVSGQGYYVASMVTAETVRPGDLLGIGLSGFPARSAVVIGWSDGSGVPMTVITDDSGRVLLNYRVRQSAHPGDHTLVAQVPGGPSASVTVGIERIRDRRRG